MFNRSNILKAAWARYRADADLLGLASFSRSRFASCLRMAWSDPKLVARIEAQMAAEEAERIANPIKAEARAELTMIQMKNHWTATDFARASTLQSAIAA